MARFMSPTAHRRRQTLVLHLKRQTNSYRVRSCREEARYRVCSCREEARYRTLCLPRMRRPSRRLLHPKPRVLEVSLC